MAIHHGITRVVIMVTTHPGMPHIITTLTTPPGIPMVVIDMIAIPAMTSLVAATGLVNMKVVTEIETRAATLPIVTVLAVELAAMEHRLSIAVCLRHHPGTLAVGVW